MIPAAGRLATRRARTGALRTARRTALPVRRAVLRFARLTRRAVARTRRRPPPRVAAALRTALRRTHYTTDMLEITPNKQVGGEPFHLRHNATPDGYYKGRRLPGFKDKK